MAELAAPLRIVALYVLRHDDKARGQACDRSISWLPKLPF